MPYLFAWWKRGRQDLAGLDGSGWPPREGHRRRLPRILVAYCASVVRAATGTVVVGVVPLAPTTPDPPPPRMAGRMRMSGIDCRHCQQENCRGEKEASHESSHRRRPPWWSIEVIECPRCFATVDVRSSRLCGQNRTRQEKQNGPELPQGRVACLKNPRLDCSKRGACWESGASPACFCTSRFSESGHPENMVPLPESKPGACTDILAPAAKRGRAQSGISELFPGTFGGFQDNPEPLPGRRSKGRWTFGVYAGGVLEFASLAVVPFARGCHA